jgi:hypothetical protein
MLQGHQKVIKGTFETNISLVKAFLMAMHNAKCLKSFTIAEDLSKRCLIDMWGKLFGETT